MSIFGYYILIFSSLFFSTKKLFCFKIFKINKYDNLKCINSMNKSKTIIYSTKTKYLY